MASNNIKKNVKGYSYKYADIAQVHEFLEEQNITYYQYIERIDGDDYIYTVPTINGEEKAPRRGCRVAQATLKGVNNPAQEQGSAITYARRYSLLMAFGLATTDDDAQCLSVPKGKSKEEPKTEEEEARDKAEEILTADREEMIKCVDAHYPIGSQNREMLLKCWGVSNIEEADDNKLRAVYNKYQGK